MTGKSVYLATLEQVLKRMPIGIGVVKAGKGAKNSAKKILQSVFGNLKL